jgi:hypothetical protein
MTTNVRIVLDAKVIYQEFFEDIDMWGFFELTHMFSDEVDKLELISAFSGNDAGYSEEYLGPLFAHCGIDIKVLPMVYYKRALRLVRKTYGL